LPRSGILGSGSLPAILRGVEAAAPAESPARAGTAARLTWLGLVLALVLLSTKARIDAALRDPLFDARHPEGLLKSDPALLYYVTERVVEAGGGVPADFRADPRVQHPDSTDLAAEFAPGQEFLVAWWHRLHRLTGGDDALHVSAVEVMAATASLAGLATALLVLFVTRSSAWALLALLLHACMPANYRTLGFVLVREDLSFPLFALHLAVLARAVARRSARLYLASGLHLGAALATWHALGFFAALEIGVLHLWFLASDRNPFEERAAWPVLIGPVLAGTLVPALASAGFAFGAPMLLAYALLAVGLVRRRRALSKAASVALAALVLGLSLALVAALAPGRSGYAHVWDLLAAKLVHLGRLPADPGAIPFDARLLWQGPFATAAPGVLAWYLGWPALVLFAAGLVLALRRSRPPGLVTFLAAFALLSLPVAWLVERTVILAGFLVPAAAAALLAYATRTAVARGVLALTIVAFAIVGQASTFLPWISSFACAWYRQPPHKDELAALVRWVGEEADPERAILGDFVSSTAVLAGTGHPICLQPKYETELSRRKAEAFLTTFFHGTSAELGALARERFDAGYLLVDRYTLGVLSAYTADALGPPSTGTAAAEFLSPDPAVYGHVAGFELLYESPAGLPRFPGEPERCYLVYEVR
jgi:hypothetical protein